MDTEEDRNGKRETGQEHMGTESELKCWAAHPVHLAAAGDGDALAKTLGGV